MGKISVKPWHSQPTTRVNRHFSLGPQQCRLNRVILYMVRLDCSLDGGEAARFVIPLSKG